ncbi:hypothetical protein SmJEL517_g01717 [Synchytrium microbalum]|uniref:Ras-GEF domain-containing protein n=1 Tax=Synchytrium microbalum TaxID=1806994 RepID=A0A507C3E5_9FUNG|nr:uncharacterized protein SmJEL517_g01717 [Synchytrium microbalum]TPX36040.1 hypothetical protein SmJEL517_g01717 [Synchytrium microbalum]
MLSVSVDKSNGGPYLVSDVAKPSKPTTINRESSTTIFELKVQIPSELASSWQTIHDCGERLRAILSDDYFEVHSHLATILVYAPHILLRPPPDSPQPESLSTPSLITIQTAGNRVSLIVERTLSVLNERLTIGLNDEDAVNYGRLERKLIDATASIERVVNRCKEYELWSGNWEDAKGTYAYLMSNIKGFATSLRDYVQLITELASHHPDTFPMAESHEALKPLLRRRTIGDRILKSIAALRMHGLVQVESENTPVATVTSEARTSRSTIFRMSQTPESLQRRTPFDMPARNRVSFASEAQSLDGSTAQKPLPPIPEGVTEAGTSSPTAAAVLKPPVPVQVHLVPSTASLGVRVATSIAEALAASAILPGILPGPHENEGITVEHEIHNSLKRNMSVSSAAQSVEMAVQERQKHGNLLHISEGGVEVLILEDLGSRLQIVAGTVDRLISRLADEHATDDEYLDIMIQTHMFFVSARDMFDQMVARFHCQPPSDGTTDTEYFVKWQKVIQLKVLNVVGRWCRLQFSPDFSNDSALRTALNGFLADAHLKGYKSEADRIRRIVTLQGTDKVKSGSSRTSTASSSMTSSPFSTARPLSNLSQLSRSSNQSQQSLPNGPATYCRGFDSPVLELDPASVAKYLTTTERRALANVTVSDVLAKVAGGIKLANPWTGEVDIRELIVNSTGAKVEKIDKIAERANRIHNWVILEIASANSVKAREKLLQKFLNVAKQCYALQNFHTMLVIAAALLSPTVSRVSKSLPPLPPSHFSTLLMLEKLLDPSSNMKAYRIALSSIHQGQAVPLFPIVLKDATFVIEGSPPFAPLANETADKEQQPPLVNFDMYRTLVTIVTAYLDIVKEPYSFESDRKPHIERLIEDRLAAADDEAGWDDTGVLSTVWNMINSDS